LGRQGKRKIAPASSMKDRIAVDQKPQRAFHSEGGRRTAKERTSKKRQKTSAYAGAVFRLSSPRFLPFTPFAVRMPCTLIGNGCDLAFALVRKGAIGNLAGCIATLRTMASAHLKCDPSGGVLVAAVLCEKISEYEANVLEPELTMLAAAHQNRLVLDMKDVQMVASVGLGMLVQLNRTLKAGGGKFVLANLSDNIKKVMKLTRLDSGLTIVATVQDGIAKAK